MSNYIVQFYTRCNYLPKSLSVKEAQDPEILTGWCHFQFDHDDVIKWKHFPRYWPFVRGIHRSPVNSPHRCQWRGASVFSLICTRINSWETIVRLVILRRNRTHYDVTVMMLLHLLSCTVTVKIGVKWPDLQTLSDKHFINIEHKC